MEVCFGFTTGDWTSGLQANACSYDIDGDLWDETGPLFEDISQYMRLVENLSISQLLN